LLPGEDAAEPEPLDVDGKMAHQPQAGPARGQHRASQGLIGKALDDAENMLALIGQG